MTQSAPAEYHLTPGYLVIPRQPTLVSGVVGAGVFVSLWDYDKHYSGCCCYMQPRAASSSERSANCGDVALPHLFDRMRKIGSEPANLRACVIGGAVQPDNRLGERNTNVAQEFLHEHRITILAEDTGGALGRKFIYNSETGENVVMKVHKLRSEDWRPVEEHSGEHSGDTFAGESGSTYV